MKKHELLKYAYDNYPKGTKFTWGGKTIISTGVFRFEGTRIVNVIKENSKEKYEFDLYDPQMINKWAEIIEQPKSILDGKVAIQISNEREFEMLMKHYDEKGWSPYSELTQEWFKNSEAVEYNDKYRSTLAQLHEEEGYTIITFSEFAKEVGIEVPVFVMKSEDGIDLYKGDKIFEATRDLRGSTTYSDWYLLDARGVGFWICDESTTPRWRMYPDVSKAFSTQEAAKKWIEQQNKPKDIIHITGTGINCQVFKDEVLIDCSCGCFSLSPKYIEIIYSAIQQLKGGENGKD